MYANNEILFPNYVIPLLRDMRGEEWRQLVDRVVTLPPSHPEVLAFVLAMIRLNGCMDCETDSYRAMRGCAMCAAQTLRRYHDPDLELLKTYDEALAEVQAYLLEQEEAVRRIA
ncbi:MAG: hypothetical protein JXB30_19570 [Anaerolineae bacterium]|nr:hypothetical protein [Anaerolineae bacterium]